MQLGCSVVVDPDKNTDNKYSVLFVGVGGENSVTRDAVETLVRHYTSLGNMHLLTRGDGAQNVADHVKAKINYTNTFRFRQEGFEVSHVGNGGHYSSLDELLTNNPPDVTVMGVNIQCPKLKGNPHRRLLLLEKNVPAVLPYAQKLKEHDYKGFVLVVTNPVDLVAYALASSSGLAVNQVGGLNDTDTYLLRMVLEEEITKKGTKKGFDPKKYDLANRAFVIGAHEDGLWVPVFSSLVKAYPKLKDVLGSMTIQEMSQRIDAHKKGEIKRVDSTYSISGERIANLVDLVGRSKFTSAEALAQEYQPTFSLCYHDLRGIEPEHIFVGVKARINNLRVEPDPDFLKTLNDKDSNALSEEERSRFFASIDVLRGRLKQLKHGKLTNDDGTVLYNDYTHQIPQLHPQQTGTAPKKKSRPDLSQEPYDVFVPTVDTLYVIHQGRIKTTVPFRLPPTEDSGAFASQAFRHNDTDYCALRYKSGILFIDVTNRTSAYGFIGAMQGRLNFRGVEVSGNNLYATHPNGVAKFNLDEVVAHTKEGIPLEAKMIPLLGSPKDLVVGTDGLFVSVGRKVFRYQPSDQGGTIEQLVALPQTVHGDISRMVVAPQKNNHQQPQISLYLGTTEGEVYSFDGKAVDAAVVSHRNAGKNHGRISSLAVTDINGERFLLFDHGYDFHHTDFHHANTSGTGAVHVRSLCDPYNQMYDLNQSARAYAVKGRIAYIALRDEVMIWDIVRHQRCGSLSMKPGYTISMTEGGR